MKPFWWSARVMIVAPLFVCAYGVLRLIGRADGRYGPGLDWQLAHLAGLAGMVLFVPVVVALGRLLPRTRVRAVTVGATLTGLACAMVQFGADIVEGLMAADKAEMRELSQRFHDIPGVPVVFYSVGPQLFFLGLVVLMVLLAVARRVPWWSPVLTFVGVIAAPVSLDFIPVTGVLLLLALLPAAGPWSRSNQDDRNEVSASRSA